MDIYDVASRIKEAEERMRKNIRDFEEASALEWAEAKEKIDNGYREEVEEFRKKLASDTDSRISRLRVSFAKSIKRYKSSKEKDYSEKARDTIKEVISL